MGLEGHRAADPGEAVRPQAEDERALRGAISFGGDTRARPRYRAQLTAAVAAVLALAFILTPGQSGGEFGAPQRFMGDEGSAVLRLLLVGDIHDDTPNVAALARAAASLRIDHVLVDGDMVNIPSAALTAPDAATTSEPSLAEIAKQMEALQPIVQGGGGRVFYIPGNHDPPQLFDPGLGLHLGGATNLHSQDALLAPGLRLIGWGGSTPAVQRSADGADKTVWQGYPYSTEGMAAESLAALPPAAAAADADDEQLLLLTHVGPSGSGTTNVWRDDEQPPIRSGSTALTSYLQATSRATSLLGLVHGHTHAGGGRSHVGFTPIFNPGPLKDGEFAILQLRRSDEPAAVPKPASAGAKRQKTDPGEGETVASVTTGRRWRVESFEQRVIPGMLDKATWAE